MINFHNYLKRAKGALSDLQNYDTVHVVLGNESCDLDSAASSLVYGYLLHTLHVKDNSPKFIAIPVLNTHEDDLPLKTETCFLLRKLCVNLRDLVFRNQIDLLKIQETSKLKITLVDHHVLPNEDKALKASVMEIYDHRPLNELAKWDKIKVDIQQVGSCSSIIANEVLNTDPTILNNGIATLLYETILFDTIGLKPEAKKVKDLDIKMVQELQKTFNLSDNYQKIFDNLWEVHNDVTHLTPLQILNKDLKVVGKIPVPALPMLAATFLKLEGAGDDLIRFCEQNDTKVCVVLGIALVDDAVHRDVAVFKTADGVPLYEKIIKDLQAGEFNLAQSSCELNGITYFTQGNIALTRKHIIPVVLNSLTEN